VITAKKGLNSIKDTHSIIPVPAYDKKDKIIEPSRYREYLAGAVVELYMNLSHWSFPANGDDPASDTYTADIFAICPLEDPNVRNIITTPSPPKRKTFAINPMSPSKRKKYL